MKFFNKVFKSITVIVTIVIVLKLLGVIINFFYDNPYKNFYFQIWINLFKEIMDFNFFDFIFDFKAWIREFLYLLFIIPHFLLFYFSPKISFLILFFPKKIFMIIDRFFPINNEDVKSQ